MSVAVVVALLCGFAGLAALGVLGWRLFRTVRSLGRTVIEASTQIAEASTALEQLNPPPLRDD